MTTLTLPIRAFVESKRVFIHIEPCPRVLYEMIPAKQNIELVTPPNRQWSKDLEFKAKGKEIIITFFYNEGGA